MQISNATAVVTGGASGLGEACARAIVGAGGKVALLDMNADKGEALAAELGDAAVFARTDVTDEADVSAALDACVAAHGGVNVAINCAGIAIAMKTLGRDGPHPLDAYRKVVDINLIGTFNVCRLASERMQQNSAGADGEMGVIINTASVAGEDGQIGQAAYSASKGGVIGMTLPIARDLMNEGIRVNTILPGIFETPLMAAAPPQVKEALAASVPFPKRLGNPEEYAHLATTMIENGYFNGEDVRLDGAIRMAPR